MDVQNYAQDGGVTFLQWVVGAFRQIGEFFAFFNWSTKVPDFDFLWWHVDGFTVSFMDIFIPSALISLMLIILGLRVFHLVNIGG